MAPGLFIVAVRGVLQAPMRHVLLASIDCALRASHTATSPHNARAFGHLLQS
jgi:hypothetical protein